MTLADVRFLRAELEAVRRTEARLTDGGWRAKALRLKLGRHAEDLAAQLLGVARYIDVIEDAELRLIFTLRYYEGMLWEQVAEGLPTRISADAARMKHDRYLKKVPPEK